MRAAKKIGAAALFQHTPVRPTLVPIPLSLADSEAGRPDRVVHDVMDEVQLVAHYP